MPATGMVAAASADPRSIDEDGDHRCEVRVIRQRRHQSVAHQRGDIDRADLLDQDQGEADGLPTKVAVLPVVTVAPDGDGEAQTDGDVAVHPATHRLPRQDAVVDPRGEQRRGMITNGVGIRAGEVGPSDVWMAVEWWRRTITRHLVIVYHCDRFEYSRTASQK